MVTFLLAWFFISVPFIINKGCDAMYMFLYGRSLYLKGVEERKKQIALEKLKVLVTTQKTQTGKYFCFVWLAVLVIIFSTLGGMLFLLNPLESLRNLNTSLKKGIYNVFS